MCVLTRLNKSDILVTVFYYYPESYKYQINIDLQDLDQYITDKNDLLELVSPSMDK